MKCIRCGHDSKYKERENKQCPNCRKPFAFEPRAGDKVTDTTFKNAIDAVSANGRMKWGVENLYYEINRRKRLKPVTGCLIVGPLLIVVALAAGFGIPVIAFLKGAGTQAFAGFPCFSIVFIIGVIVTGVGLYARYTKRVQISREKFDDMWQKYCAAHGKPEGVIERKAPTRPRRPIEPDIEDYSFDRAVICDRARTVDLLLANNFHFENNCAVLAVNGYPAGPFELVRKMLKRNPRLHVFALHDASPDGCRLAHRLASDPEWFKGQAKVTDVGLRPKHAGPFRGLLLPAAGAVAAGAGITPSEASWLSSNVLELAAIRPEQILKRLFRALNRKVEEEKDHDLEVDFEDDDRMGVDYDYDSFGVDASDGDASADSFG